MLVGDEVHDQLQDLLRSLDDKITELEKARARLAAGGCPANGDRGLLDQLMHPYADPNLDELDDFVPGGGQPGGR